MSSLILPDRWDKKRTLAITISIQLAMLGSIGLDYIGYEIPILRQITGFIYLTFIPGIVLLKILNIKKTTSANFLLYSVGLSITLLMFIGVLLNKFLPLLGIMKPLTPLNILVSVSLFVVASLIYIFLYEPLNTPTITVNKFSYEHVSMFFLLVLILILSIIGSWYSNTYRNHSITIFGLSLIPVAIIVMFFLRDKIKSELYPIITYVLALSLLFHYSLISWYLFGYDIHYEYHVFELVKNNFIWNSTSPSTNVNSMISVTILPTIYYYFLDMDGTWLIKIIYPTIFSFVPVALFQMYKSQMDDWFAFISVFFLMSNITFFTEMTMLARQEIAELFFVLILLLITDKSIKSTIKKFIVILFSISIVLSHYGLSYIYLFYLFMFPILTISLNNLKRFQHNMLKQENIFTSRFFILIFVVTISWYIYNSNSSAFSTIVNLLSSVVENISSDLLSSDSKDPVIATALGSNPVGISKIHLLHIYFKRFTFVFIIVGYIKYLYELILNQNEQTVNSYTIISLISFFFLLLVVLLPSLSSSWNMTRLYHIVLLTLAPFAIYGLNNIMTLLLSLLNPKVNLKNFVKLIPIIFLVTFFMLEIGLIDVYCENPTSAALDLDSQDIVSLNGALTHEQEVYSAKWLYENKKNGQLIYSDNIARKHVLTSYGLLFSNKLDLSFNTRLRPNSYIYLRWLNTVHEIVPQHTRATGWKEENLSTVIPELSSEHKIYSNSESEIYLT